MKVGVFTFPNSISYGATLQMYALYRMVEQLGHEAEVINYHNAFMRAEKHCQPPTQSDFKFKIKRTIRRLLHASVYRKFRAFEQGNMKLYPNKPFSDKSVFPLIERRYDAMICGSDQVWNPNITSRDLSYFFDFCSEPTKRISYAPSFGLDLLPEDFAAEAKKELTKFSSLSVRELQGQTIVADMIGREVPIVLDPTMLLNADDWRGLEAPYQRVKGEYLLYFTIKSSHHLFKRSRDFAQKHGLTMVVVGGRITKKIRSGDPVVQYAIDLSPVEWLWLVDHARYVVTNSFHGTAFSVIFEKDFYLELSSETNSRLSNIVNILGLQDRVISTEEIIPSQANYTNTRENLIRLREESIDYLKDALSEGAIHG